MVAKKALEDSSLGRQSQIGQGGMCWINSAKDNTEFSTYKPTIEEIEKETHLYDPGLKSSSSGGANVSLLRITSLFYLSNITANSVCQRRRGLISGAQRERDM